LTQPQNGILRPNLTCDYKLELRWNLSVGIGLIKHGILEHIF